VPNDIVREKQAQLADRLSSAKSRLGKLSISATKREKLILEAVRKAEDCHVHYREAEPIVRREWNQSWWDMVELDINSEQKPVVHNAVRAAMPEGIHHVRNKTDNIPIKAKVEEILKNRHIDAGDLHDVPESGSRVEFLAGAAGLEPTTPGFGDQCSTN
jgi:hypothetical protein